MTAGRPTPIAHPARTRAGGRSARPSAWRRCHEAPSPRRQKRSSRAEPGDENVPVVNGVNLGFLSPVEPSTIRDSSTPERVRSAGPALLHRRPALAQVLRRHHRSPHLATIHPHRHGDRLVLARKLSAGQSAINLRSELIADHLRSELVPDALRNAAATSVIEPDAISHSDREASSDSINGSKTSAKYRTLAIQRSDPGNPTKSTTVTSSQRWQRSKNN